MAAQRAAQRAAENAAENAEEVVPEAVPEENNAPGSLDEAEDAPINQEILGIFELLSLASNNVSSDIKELESRPFLRKILGKVSLTLYIKITGVWAFLAPLMERCSFEFSGDGYKYFDIDILFSRLLLETKE